MSDFTVKDSGQREQYASGMVRDTAQGKTDYTLTLDGPMFERWAEHLTKGARKYAKRNWMLASGEAELERFKESALRHFIQWLRGDRDEDHAAAVFFGVNGAEYVRDRQLRASAESESAHSPAPPAPASRRSNGSIVLLSQAVESLPDCTAAASPHSAPDLCQANHESEHRRPGPDGGGPEAQSADRPQRSSRLSQTDRQQLRTLERPELLGLLEELGLGI